MDIDSTLLDAEDRMEKALAALERDFAKLRTGRASTALVDGIKADYYGTPTPISQMASVAVPDPRTLTIQPWDKGGIAVVEKAILKSDLGLTPVNDGKIIRIVIPPLTEERRKELVKVARKYSEDAKVAVRNVRGRAEKGRGRRSEAHGQIRGRGGQEVRGQGKGNHGHLVGARCFFTICRSSSHRHSSMVQAQDIPDNLPAHIAIIMDGNGRWAQARGLSRSAGHRAGAETVRNVVTQCRELGIRHLTLYAFSSENWNRPKAEISALFSLLLEFLQHEVPLMEEKGIALKVLGDLDGLPLPQRTALRHAMSRTEAGREMTLNLALNYGGRAELVRAVRSLLRENARPEDVTEESLAERLYTAGQPDPDLLIRTSGEQRLSNYLLYQCAYSELYFTPVPWPDFGAEQLREALAVYAGRSRRFGKIQEQVDVR